MNLAEQKLATVLTAALTNVLTGTIRAYQLICRPLLPAACKFTPSCSDYAIGALREHGVLRGLVMAAWRILRCNPFTAGGYDPVPRNHPRGCRHTEDIGAP
jgi:putative membrane protein insertion efficiency factor